MRVMNCTCEVVCRHVEGLQGAQRAQRAGDAAREQVGRQLEVRQICLVQRCSTGSKHQGHEQGQRLGVKALEAAVLCAAWLCCILMSCPLLMSQIYLK